MTFEEMERTMQFILDQEAKNTVALERLGEEIKEQQVLAQQHQQLLDRHEHLLDRCAKLIYGLAENQVKAEERMARADERMARLEEYLLRAVEQYDSRQARMETQLAQLAREANAPRKNQGEAPSSANDLS